MAYQQRLSEVVVPEDLSKGLPAKWVRIFAGIAVSRYDSRFHFVLYPDLGNFYLPTSTFLRKLLIVSTEQDDDEVGDKKEALEELQLR